jgi:hypothetical protein
MQTFSLALFRRGFFQVVMWIVQSIRGARFEAVELHGDPTRNSFVDIALDTTIRISTSI